MKVASKGSSSASAAASNCNPLSSNILTTHQRNLSQKNISKYLHTSLPSQFYHSIDIYELERRAIFSKRWILISHEARYRTAGDFVQYDMAGYNIVILRNKDQRIVGFHNICRHRAYPVVEKESGHSSILACKYHGWSYSLDGKLTKAPRFTSDSVPDFDPSEIRLFPINVHVDRNGFVYVNLDAREGGPEMSWEEQYEGLDTQDVLLSSGIDWNSVVYDFTWTAEGNYNWKLMQDNYNECYHCLTAHPEVAKTTRLDNYYVEPGALGTYICHFSEPKASSTLPSSQPSQFSTTRFSSRSATHVFPVGHFSPNPGTGFLHLMRTIPTSATTVRQEYDVYKLNTPTATKEAHERMTAFYKQVTAEDVALCNAAQRNLQRGVFVNGPLHPFHEEGVWAFQQTLKRILLQHVEDEEAAGRKIYPAQYSLRVDDQSQSRGGVTGDPASDRILAACGGNSVELDW